MTGVIDTDNKSTTGVVDTGHKSLNTNISVNDHNIFKMLAPHDHSHGRRVCSGKIKKKGNDKNMITKYDNIKR